MDNPPLEPKTLYVLGPMTGYPLHNFPAFDKAKAELIAHSYRVISPADLSRAYGMDEHDDTDLSPEAILELQRHGMKVDLPAICDCYGLALLPDFNLSGGGQVELALAHYLKLKVNTVIGWIADCDLYSPYRLETLL